MLPPLPIPYSLVQQDADQGHSSCRWLVSIDFNQPFTRHSERLDLNKSREKTFFARHQNELGGTVNKELFRESVRGFLHPFNILL